MSCYTLTVSSSLQSATALPAADEGQPETLQPFPAEPESQEASSGDPSQAEKDAAPDLPANKSVVDLSSAVAPQEPAAASQEPAAASQPADKQPELEDPVTDPDVPSILDAAADEEFEASSGLGQELEDAAAPAASEQTLPEPADAAKDEADTKEPLPAPKYVHICTFPSDNELMITLKTELNNVVLITTNSTLAAP